MVRGKRGGVGREGVWELLGNRPVCQVYGRGEHLYTPEEPAQALFLIVSGVVRLQLVSSEGRTLTMRLVEAGQACGHLAITRARLYDTYAEALGPVTAYRIQRRDVQHVLAERPGMALSLIEELGQHCLALSRRLDEVASLAG